MSIYFGRKNSEWKNFKQFWRLSNNLLTLAYTCSSNFKKLDNTRSFSKKLTKEERKFSNELSLFVTIRSNVFKKYSSLLSHNFDH